MSSRAADPAPDPPSDPTPPAPPDVTAGSGAGSSAGESAGTAWGPAADASAGTAADSTPGGAAPGPRVPSGRSIAAAAGSIALITLVARVVGFGRWFVFSHAVGATCVGSVYQSVNAVPNILFEIAAGGVLAAVAVPLVAAFLARGDRASADRTASALLGWALAVLVPLAIVVAVAAGPIASWLLGSSADCTGAVALGTDLLRVFAIQIPLYGVGIVLAGVLQSHGRFTGAALAPLLSSLVVIGVYVAYRGLVDDPAAPIPDVPTPAILVLGIGTTVGVAALSLPLLVPARRAGVHLRPSLTFPAGVAARVRRLAVAGLLAVAGQQVATLVVIRLANDRGGPGTLNVHTYVQAVSLLPYAVLAVPLATAAFPTLAGQATGAPRGERPDGGTAPGSAGGPDGDPGGWSGSAPSGPDPVPAVGTVPHDVQLSRDTLRTTWLATLLAGLLSAGLLVAVARPVGAFFSALDAGRDEPAGAAALAAIPATLVSVAPGIAALSAIGLLSRASYVRGRARSAGLVVALGWAATTILPIAAIAPEAGPGEALRLIALGTSLGLLVAAVALAVLVRRAWGPGALHVPARTLVAGLLATAAAAAVGWWIGGRWEPTGLVGAALACGVLGVGAVLVFGFVGTMVDPSLRHRLLRRVRPRPVPREEGP